MSRQYRPRVQSPANQYAPECAQESDLRRLAGHCAALNFECLSLMSSSTPGPFVLAHVRLLVYRLSKVQFRINTVYRALRTLVVRVRGRTPWTRRSRWNPKRLRVSYPAVKMIFERLMRKGTKHRKRVLPQPRTKRTPSWLRRVILWGAALIEECSPWLRIQRREAVQRMRARTEASRPSATNSLSLGFRWHL